VTALDGCLLELKTTWGAWATTDIRFKGNREFNRNEEKKKTYVKWQGASKEPARREISHYRRE
jgi:hypothetical protein